MINSDNLQEKVDNCLADYLLIDSGRGSGNAIDLSCLPKTNRPYFIAGGITQDNVSEIINTYHPFAIDISSGIETNKIINRNNRRMFQ